MFGLPCALPNRVGRVGMDSRMLHSIALERTITQCVLWSRAAKMLPCGTLRAITFDPQVQSSSSGCHSKALDALERVANDLGPSNVAAVVVGVAL